MDSLKVCLNLNGKNRIFYSDLVQSYKEFLNKCENDFTNVESMYKYWIDEDGDRIEINGENSYKMFLKASLKKRIFIEKEETISPVREDLCKKPGQIPQEKLAKKPKDVKFSTTPISQNKDGKKEKNDKKEKDEKTKDAVHRRVSCDTCDVTPIVGFRYKCLECPDFDLCMTCEGKRLHSHHKMIRIPEPLWGRRRRLSNLCGIAAEAAGTAAADNSGTGCPFIDPSNDITVALDIPLKDFCPRRRHGRHQKRHGGGKMFTDLFQMFNEMAGNYTNKDAEKNQEKQSENLNEEKKDKTENLNDEKKDKNEYSTFPPFGENCGFQNLYDPETIKAGAELLKNFSPMFAQFLEPFGINVDINVDNETNKKSENNENSAPEKSNKTEEKVILEDAPPTPTSEVIGGAVGVEKSTDKQGNQDDIDWTIIDKSLNEKIVTSKNSSGGGASPKSKSSSSPINYAQLNKDLEKHVLEEEQRKNKIKITDVTYHKKPHINNAVIAMMAMGFSNEGQWLTHLLESVDGDIAQALDLLKPGN